MNTLLSSLARRSRYCLTARPYRYQAKHQGVQRCIRYNCSQTPKMAAPDVSLEAKLKSLSIVTPLPTFPNCYPELNPTDIYRAHLTSLLTEVTGVDSKIIYPALQWTQTLDKGDLVLPIPALRVKGKKPPELAAEWIAKVRGAICISRTLLIALSPVSRITSSTQTHR